LAASVGDAVVSLAAAVTAAVLIHQWIERPANLAMRRRLDRALVTTG
jgi:peptidoglycan/LPS O-acetylase OafA/YrhL